MEIVSTGPLSEALTVSAMGNFNFVLSVCCRQQIGLLPKESLGEAKYKQTHMEKHNQIDSVVHTHCSHMLCDSTDGIRREINFPSTFLFPVSHSYTSTLSRSDSSRHTSQLSEFWSPTRSAFSSVFRMFVLPSPNLSFTPILRELSKRANHY